MLYEQVENFILFNLLPIRLQFFYRIDVGFILG